MGNYIPNTNPNRPSNANTVRRIATRCFNTAIEIAALSELLRGQNQPEVRKSLAESGLQNTRFVLENALLARLVVLLAREYETPRKDDRNLQMAINLLTDGSVRDALSVDAKVYEELMGRWSEQKLDRRLISVKFFRDKYTAHVAEPVMDPLLPSYSDLFSFASETVDCIDRLALIVGLAVSRVSDGEDMKREAAEFWEKWSGDGGSDGLNA